MRLPDSFRHLVRMPPSRRVEGRWNGRWIVVELFEVLEIRGIAHDPDDTRTPPASGAIQIGPIDTS